MSNEQATEEKLACAFACSLKGRFLSVSSQHPDMPRMLQLEADTPYEVVSDTYAPVRELSQISARGVRKVELLMPDGETRTFGIDGDIFVVGSP